MLFPSGEGDQQATWEESWEAEWKKPWALKSLETQEFRKKRSSLLLPDPMKPGSWALVHNAGSTGHHCPLTPKAAIRSTKGTEEYTGFRHPKSGGSINEG